MKKHPKQEAWIAMVDYMHHGVRKEKTRIDPFATRRYATTFPETWVPMEQSMLHGVRKKHQVTEESLVLRLKPPPPAQVVPREAYMTIFHALEAFWAVPRPNGAVFARLKAIHASDQAEWAAGRITTEEFHRRQEALNAIRVGYAQGVEEVRDLFLERFFRLFETLPYALEE
ncbi:MAG: hypothetical protein HQL96_06285 [Magnetococcales bacterium]|nr:hypothetical protein [Magnetococcales bacterium]